MKNHGVGVQVGFKTAKETKTKTHGKSVVKSFLSSASKIRIHFCPSMFFKVSTMGFRLRITRPETSPRSTELKKDMNGGLGLGDCW